MADTAMETSIKDYAWGRIDPTLARQMRSPGQRGTVRARLVDMVDSLQDQLDARPPGGEWRGKAISLLGKLEDMLAEFDALCSDEATKLREAIERHRRDVESFERHDDETYKSTEEIDEELWAVLDA